MPRRRFAAAVVLALVGAACGSDDGEPPSANNRTVDDREFLSAMVIVDDEPLPLVDGTQIALSFGENEISADAGCNSMFGAYAMEGNVLVVDGLGMTEIGCDPARSEQDVFVADFLTSRPTIALDGPNLTLTNDTTSVEMIDREVADPDRSLTGTTWELDTIVDGDAASNVPIPQPATLFIDDHGQAAVFTGCNAGMGTATIDGDSLRIAQLAVEERACPAPVSDVEVAVLRVLGAEMRWIVEADRLTLDAGSEGLGFRAP